MGVQYIGNLFVDRVSILNSALAVVVENEIWIYLFKSYIDQMVSGYWLKHFQYFHYIGRPEKDEELEPRVSSAGVISENDS